MELSEEEKIERLLNSIAKGCDGSIADEVKAIIIKQQKEIEREKQYTDFYKDLCNKQQKEIEELNKNKQQINYNEIFSPDFVEENFISKDKIREWLDRFDIEEELQDKYDELLGSEAIYKFLKKLLKEN